MINPHVLSSMLKGGSVKNDKSCKKGATKGSGSSLKKKPKLELAVKKSKHRRKLSKKNQQLLLQKTLGDNVKKSKSSSKKQQDVSLSMEEVNSRLQGSKFRYLNEILYSMSSADAFQMFKDDASAFEIYHQGFCNQRSQWDKDPVDDIVSWCRQLTKGSVLADFGCGDARLSAALSKNYSVHSFDFVKTNDRVTACDMAHTPLTNSSVDVCIFCLSLMNTNCTDLLVEANRVLKKQGQLYITEISSRVESAQRLASLIEKLGFSCTHKRTDKYFVELIFKKGASVKNRPHLPQISLAPCLYKKR